MCRSQRRGALTAKPVEVGQYTVIRSIDLPSRSVRCGLQTADLSAGSSGVFIVVCWANARSVRIAEFRHETGEPVLEQTVGRFDNVSAGSCRVSAEIGSLRIVFKGSLDFKAYVRIIFEPTLSVADPKMEVRKPSDVISITFY